MDHKEKLPKEKLPIPSSPSKSDSGYSSFDSTPEKIRKSLSGISEARSLISNSFTNEIVFALEEKPEEWRTILSKLGRMIADQYTWSELDLACIRSYNVTSPNSNGFSLLMMAQTKAVLEPGFLIDLFSLYEEKTKIKVEAVLVNCLHRKKLNFLHCLAEQVGRKYQSGSGALSNQNWEVYKKMCSLLPTLLNSEDAFERTPDQIVYSSGALEEYSNFIISLDEKANS